MQSPPGLLKVFLVFLKMGATAFGGNVALVAAIRREISEKRNWVSDQEILDLMVIGNILPGPLATNVVFACGKLLHGVAGAFIALFGVLLPSFVLMCFLSWMYFSIGNNVAFTAVMNGIIPCVAAIIAATAWNLHRKNVKGWMQHAIVVGAAVAMLLWKGFFLTLIIVGVAAIAGRLFMYTPAQKPVAVKKEKSVSVFILPAIMLLLFAGIFFLPEFSQALSKMKSLALTFGSMSVTLFGGGYVFIPTMEKVVVHEMFWMTTREFTEGIALGQITPGPIMISSVFIGWKVAGLKGAATAAIALFVPPAVVMYVAQHYLQRIKANATAEAALRGVRPAVIGMIFASVWVVFSSGQVDFFAAGIFVVIFAVAVWKNPEPIFMILASGVAGWLIY
ncbi:MAG TPA: chromate efflux transporter [Bacteroidia bacterium]|nr:chromate efflux transporter [Bacteroidia bacterium]